VDYEVGNIEYEGRIVIHGDIKPGFTVISRTGVLVRGEVMDGAQVSSEGPIDVEGNICLGEKGLIICGADLGADQILDSRVEVVGNVNVERLILNSNVVCGGHLTMVQPDSQIRGGRIEAVQGISVSIAGAPSGAPTVLVTGITLAYHEEAKKLGQAAGELSRRIDDAVSNYQKAWPAEEHETYVGPQRERFLDAKARVDQTSKIGMERLAKWKQRRQELRDKFAQCEDETMIKVLRRVLPGVMICIGPKANITIKQVIEKETFFQEKGEIRRLSLAN
jgi:uncharacterized protein (DUF342 family)